MIDTDKYEGHTPGPWSISDCGHGYIDAQNWIGSEGTGDGWVQSVAKVSQEDGEQNLVHSNVDTWKANAQLIADAPLFLQEIERLHVEVRALRKAQGYDMKFPVEVLVIDEYMSENRQLRKQKEMYLECIHASQFKDKPGSAMSRLNQMLFLQRSDEK